MTLTTMQLAEILLAAFWWAIIIGFIGCGLIIKDLIGKLRRKRVYR